MKMFQSVKVETECVGTTRAFFPALNASEDNLVSQSVLTEPNADTGYNNAYAPSTHTTL